MVYRVKVGYNAWYLQVNGHKPLVSFDGQIVARNYGAKVQIDGYIPCLYDGVGAAIPLVFLEAVT